MQSIQQTLKNQSVNGAIPVERALQVAAPLDAERTATVALLKELERQVGMTYGDKINAHIAAMNGTKFNEVDYWADRLPGEQ
jgi:hypothetical protein